MPPIIHWGHSGSTLVNRLSSYRSSESKKGGLDYPVEECPLFERVEVTARVSLDGAVALGMFF